jgi:YbbR domain-containing protein
MEVQADLPRPFHFCPLRPFLSLSFYMSWSSFKTKISLFAQHAWDSIRHDIWRKVFALLLATICWLYINNMHVRHKSRQWDTIEEVKVDLRGSPKVFIPEQLTPKVRLKISVNFSARSKRFTAGDFRLEVDPLKLPLDGGVQRRSLRFPYRVTLTDKEHVLRKPAGVSILGFDPPEVPIYFDTRDILQKNVHVPLQGALKKGLRQKLTVTPETISVTGPLSIIDPLLVIETEPLLLNETMQHDFSTKLKVFNPDSRMLEIYPDSVEVRVSIEDTQSYSRQKFSPVPLGILIRPDSGLQMTSKLPAHVASILHGQISSLEAVERNRLKAILDLTTFSQPGTYHVPVQIIGMPGDLKAEYINPSACMVTLGLLPQPPPAVDQAPPGGSKHEEPQ